MKLNKLVKSTVLGAVSFLATAAPALAQATTSGGEVLGESTGPGEVLGATGSPAVIAIVVGVFLLGVFTVLTFKKTSVSRA